MRPAIHIVATVALLMLVAACGPSIDTRGQFMTSDGGQDLGLRNTQPAEGPIAVPVVSATYSTFAPGAILPSTTNLVTQGSWNGNDFSALVLGGGGALPISIAGTAIDDDADDWPTASRSPSPLQVAARRTTPCCARTPSTTTAAGMAWSANAGRPSVRSIASSPRPDPFSGIWSRSCPFEISTRTSTPAVS